MASKNADFSFTETSSSSEDLAKISSDLDAPLKTTDASSDTTFGSSSSLDASVDSLVVEVARPPMAAFGRQQPMTEESVLATLSRYGRGGGKRSFLESLGISSGSSPDCHRLAMPYLRGSFKAIKKALALECYQLFNETLFKGMLPRKEPVVKWQFCHDNMGAFRAPDAFRLGSYCVDEPFKVANAMLMLMCLAATDGTDRDGTTRHWDMWSEIAKAMFPELLQPTLKRLTVVHFEIDVFRFRTPLPRDEDLPTL